MNNRDVVYVDLLYSTRYTNVDEYIMDVIKVFSKNLREYRMRSGLSQKRFAEKTGLHRTYISAIECEKRSISLDNIQKIADALQIDTYLLFIDHDDIKPGGEE